LILEENDKQTVRVSLRKLIIAGVALVLAACSESSKPTAPEPLSEVKSESEMPTCRSGYAIANRNGEWVCEPIE
jgi:hypothetical protein